MTAKPRLGFRAWEAAWVVVLLGAFLFQAQLDARRTSLTYDEHTYIPAGHSYLVKRDFRVNREHPPLAKLVAALPLLSLDLDDPTADRIFASLPTTGTSMGQWEYGEEFLFGHNLPRLDDVIVHSRTAMLVFPLLWLGVVYTWSRRLFGRAGGLLSLATASLSPDVIGHGSLATNDVPLASLFLATTYLTWRYLRQPRARTLVLLGLALGAALTTKFSALLLLPTCVMLGLAAWLDPALRTSGQRTRLRCPLGDGHPTRRLFSLAGAFSLVLAVAVFVVWACFLFSESLVAYIDGLRCTYTLVRSDFEAFAFGRYQRGGFWYYFVAAVAIKLPLGHWGMLAIAAVTSLRERAAFRDATSTARFDAVCVALPAMIVIVAVSVWAEQIGHRYAFPAYGALFIAVGATGKLVEQGAAALAQRRWTGGIAGLAVLALTVSAAVSSVGAAPFHLSYANAIVPSPKALLSWFDLGVVDWKQGWKEVARLQRSGELPDVGLYTPERLPRAARVYGISHAPTRLTSAPPAPGTYLFSSNDFFRARHANRRLGVHVPLLEEHPFDVIAGCVVAVRVSERLPPLPPALETRVDERRDESGRVVGRGESFEDATGRKVLHGKYTAWRSNGTREVSHYRLGELHGSYVKYRADGSASEVGTMWRGRLHGYATRLDPWGRQVGRWRYIDGTKVVTR